jgi:hypothetical protein
VLTRGTFASVVAVLLMLLSVVGLALGPYPAWWGLYAPTAAAAFQLREEKYLSRRDGCASGALQSWQQLYQDPEGRLWFRAVVRDAWHPAARIYALAGLYALDRAAFDSALRALKPQLIAEPLPVVDSGRVRRVSFEALLPELITGRLTAIYSDVTPRPEC